jgi:hypothetical protein
VRRHWRAHRGPPRHPPQPGQPSLTSSGSSIRISIAPCCSIFTKTNDPLFNSMWTTGVLLSTWGGSPGKRSEESAIIAFDMSRTPPMVGLGTSHDVRCGCPVADQNAVDPLPAGSVSPGAVNEHDVSHGNGLCLNCTYNGAINTRCAQPILRMPRNINEVNSFTLGAYLTLAGNEICAFSAVCGPRAP